MSAESRSLSGGFRVRPSDIPNKGILFVDHQKQGRSGHGGNCLTECQNGDIIACYSNVSGEIWKGHGVAGWSEYRRSTDGGQTWGEPAILEYSKRAWEGEEMYAAIVFALATAPNGTLVAFACRFENAEWLKKSPPVTLLSHDHGASWSAPRDLDAAATVEDVSLTFDATFTHNGQIFVAFMGGTADYCVGPYSLYVSADNGESFQRQSILPFNHANYYVTAGVLDSGDIIVYSYPYRENAEINEHDIPYVISADEGKTWSEVRTTRFARKIRNPQFSGKIGDLYFLQGRSGSYGEDPRHLVLYASTDGIHWDDGLILHRKETGGGDAYSANEVIGKNDAEERNRLLIQSSIAYESGNSRVNAHHWWVEDIAGA